MDKRTMTMNWDGLGEIDDDDHFFESRDRISSVVPVDLASSGSDEEDFDDSRISFASAISSASINEFRNYNPSLKYQPSMAHTASNIFASPVTDDYNVWMAEPGSIRERRQRLLQGMGLSGDRELLRLTSIDLKRGLSTKVGNSVVVTAGSTDAAAAAAAPLEELKHQNEALSCPSPLSSSVLVRSRSDSDIETSSTETKKRKEQIIGLESKQQLTRTCSELCKATGGGLRGVDANLVRIMPKDAHGAVSEPTKKRGLSSAISSSTFGAFFLIKNLDTGKEFIVNEFDNEGMWNRLSDLQTGKQLTREEFEKCVGHSPVVKELMRRENRMANGDIGGTERKVNANSYLTRSFRYSKRRGVAILKNIKGVANSMGGLLADKEHSSSSLGDQQRVSKNATNSEWVKVRAQGKSHKELTALRLCQEIQAHEGSIWTIKFSSDACYLASAGEDRVVHVWEVQECEVMPLRSPEHGILTPFQSGGMSPDLGFLGGESPGMTPPAEKKKKGKKKGNSIPDYVYVPETVFSLSEKPFCSFTGHQDDVLDLSWSRSQLLLSSSMDKTVRLWDLETKSCLKLFAHNDYVTCIQFNPVDDRYFISGSLDAKVRIWNIPNRQVVDWTDLHEMVTAACYTPDGQGALIGSHKGSCRMYSLNDCKLNQIGQIDISTKKSQAKKITGFQFAPGNPSDVLITSADSRIRIYDGTEIVHKFRGFRNTNSQISATYGQEGVYIVSASEDSQVYVWKCDEYRNSGKKGSVTTRSHEHFHCKDVSVAIPWPGCIKGDPPAVPLNSKRHSKRSTPTPSNNGSPTREEANAASKRNLLPPLPKRKDVMERAATCPEEDPAQVSRTDSEIGVGDSFSSSSASLRYGDSPSMSSGSQSWSPSWSLFDGGSHGAQTIQPTAWGFVIVTAGLGGEIRAYQNFGLPVRIGRQTNLF
uniref:WD repeat-containing protein 44 n=1 Tax=Kalanchoe fedtschenkoi TaxID=63787 RepID=A0A7N0ZY53_KALFE